MDDFEKELFKMLGYRKDYNSKNRVVKQEYIEFEGNNYYISTVDLGLDHSFGRGQPLYYETMIFPSDEVGYNELGLSMYCKRYTDREEALKEHEALVYNILNGNYEIIDEYFVEK